jgi:hypothetical protein
MVLASYVEISKHLLPVFTSGNHGQLQRYHLYSKVPVSMLSRPAARAVVRKNYIPSACLVPESPAPSAGAALLQPIMSRHQWKPL